MKTALVLGMGKSGVSAARLLKEKGFAVAYYDDRDETQYEWESRRGYSLSQILDGVSLVVVNPAVDCRHPVITGAKARGIRVIGEIQLAYEYSNCEIVAVTGTNGKTTTVSLIKEIFANAGYRAYALGNIGTPFSEYADKLGEDDVAVLELSSFQLETTDTFAADTAVCLNVTEDHTERHKTFENYIAAKKRIFANMKEDSCAVLNYDDETVKNFASDIDCNVYWFSLRSRVRGAYLEDGMLIFDDGAKTVVCAVSDLAMTGDHNIANALAAVAVAKVYGIENEYIRQTLTSFRAPEYRISYRGTYSGTRVYNDSKSTNIDSTLQACRAMKGDTALIVGGWDKKICYDALFSGLPDNVKHLICCGDNSDEIISCVPSDAGFSVVKTATLERAVQLGFSYKCENLLFSPSTSSFDRYTDYKQRGKHFDEAVKVFANEF